MIWKITYLEVKKEYCSSYLDIGMNHSFATSEGLVQLQLTKRVVTHVQPEGSESANLESIKQIQSTTIVIMTINFQFCFFAFAHPDTSTSLD